MAIEITDYLVARIARLSRLGLSPEEAAEIKGHFQKILQFVEILDHLDVSSVDPSIFPLETVNILRTDDIQPSLPVEEALRNAPTAKNDHFVVPRIIAASSGEYEADEAEPEEFA